MTSNILQIGNDMFNAIQKIENDIIEKYIKEYFSNDEIVILESESITKITFLNNQELEKIEFYKNMSGGFVLITLKKIENIKIPLTVFAADIEIFEKILLTLKF